jgi:peptidoglycan/LPS O-acetylase OafA/YrhL
VEHLPGLGRHAHGQRVEVGLIGAFMNDVAASSNGDGRIPQLDGLRAIAVLLVFVYHVWGIRLPGGHVGVDIFFVLSGYLITTILLNELDATGTISFRSFYWRRLLRLTPAFFLLLAFYAAIYPAVFGWDHLIAAPSSLYVMNWIRAFHLGPEGFLGHTWSLAIEEQFYLMWPLVLLFIARLGKTWLRASLCLAIIGIMAWRLDLFLHGATVDRLYNGFDTRSDSLFVGCLLACSPLFSSIVARVWPIATALILAEALTLHYDSPLLPEGLFTLTALASASIISSLLSPTKNLLQIVLRTRPLVRLGEISYGFYLWHYIFTAPLTAMHVRSFVVASIALPLTLGAAWLSFNYVEKPFLKLRHKVTSSTHHGLRSH